MISSALDFIDPETIIALEMLHDASTYISDQFGIHMTRDEAKANFDARAIFFNCSNQIFKEFGCRISREEVEGVAIIERELGK